MRVLGVIPARMASTRFPGKALVDIAGKSMLQRVFEQARKSPFLNEIIIATDHEDIFKAAQSFGAKVMMTSTKHQNGTERCAEVLANLNSNFDILINIQGDEPFFDPQNIESLLSCFKQEEVQIASLVKRIEREEDISNPTVVKVVFNEKMKALYFSRAAIPFDREKVGISFHKHIGIYAFRAEPLKDLVVLKPSRLESIENLEQLRWLENNYSIHLALTEHDSNSVDTPEDLLALKKQFKLADG
ncbi:MAG: 3-deoxy-manno-octulosonate cytidylyltransferase [Bacteroidetes bacterium]|nr:3-deoxy-manno-octulosonate cytidylyltransferase [Bacteroidota bacterium]